MKSLRRPASKFDLDQSERKSSQFNASARKDWPHAGSQVDPSFQLTSTWESVSPGLNVCNFFACFIR